MRKWRPIPAGEVTRGRPYGDTPQKHGHLGASQHSYGPGKPCTMMIRLPDDLGETLRRACYWKSIKAIEGLRAWADQWGNGPVVVEREAQRAGIPLALAALVAMGAKRAHTEALAEREDLRKKVITTGDVLRDAVRMVLAEGIPASGPPRTVGLR